MITLEEAEKWKNKILYTDWHYAYSDDYGVYSRGRSSVMAVQNEAKKENWSDEDYELIKSLIVKEAEERVNEQRREAYIEAHMKTLDFLRGMNGKDTDVYIQ